MEFFTGPRNREGQANFCVKLTYWGFRFTNSMGDPLRWPRLLKFLFMRRFQFCISVQEGLRDFPDIAKWPQWPHLYTTYEATYALLCLVFEIFAKNCFFSLARHKILMNFSWNQAWVIVYHSEITYFGPLIMVCGAILTQNHLGTHSVSRLQTLGSHAHNRPQAPMSIFCISAPVGRREFSDIAK